METMLLAMDVKTVRALLKAEIIVDERQMRGETDYSTNEEYYQAVIDEYNRITDAYGKEYDDCLNSGFEFPNRALNV